MGARTTDRLRRHPRASLRVLVKEKNSKAFPYYMSKNVSEEGMFLTAKNPHPVGTKMILEFTLPDHRLSISVAGVTVSQVAFDPTKRDETLCGMGVKFLDPAEEVRAAIRKFVTKSKAPHDRSKTHTPEGTDTSGASQTHDL